MTPQALLAPARLARKPILATQSDERLVDLVRAGYEPAFEAIVARYRAPLVRYCGRFLPEPRAEDVVQQTFVNAYAAMQGGNGELRLRGWLHRIAHNTALNALRDRGLQHEQLNDQLDGVERPDQALERRQGLRDVLTAVQALPNRQRDALVLRELEGRSYEEIALELGVSGGAVRQLLNRARTTLRNGASAITPAGLVTRIPWSEPTGPVAARIAELCGAGAGALAAKVCATALVTGAVVGGVAALPKDGRDERTATAADSAPSRHAPPGDSSSGAPGSTRGVAVGTSDGLRRSETGEHHSGTGGSGSDDGDDRSGTSGGSDSSGPGGGGGDDRSGSSGSGSSGSDSSDSSGSGSSGSGSSGSGSSGSDSSGSGSSGSDSSGSGSGSSGSGDLTTSTMDSSSGPGSGSGSSGSSGSDSGSLQVDGH
ncbi:MAG: RNA polymerase sigma factor [Thermoleophilaceae bacterium]